MYGVLAVSMSNIICVYHYMHVCDVRMVNILYGTHENYRLDDMCLSQ